MLESRNTIASRQMGEDEYTIAATSATPLPENESTSLFHSVRSASH